MKVISRVYLLLVLTFFLFTQCKKNNNTSDFFNLWEKLSTPYFGNFIDIRFISNDTGYILGSDTLSANNILVKTCDGGRTWSKINFSHKFLNDTSGGVMQLLNVSPFSANIVFSGRTNIIRSTDGGYNWNVIDHASSGYVWGNCHFFSPSTIIRSGENIYKSLDSGITWTNVYNISAGGYAFFTMLQFTNNQIGYTAGGIFYDATNYGVMSKTTDGGNSWQTIDYPFHDIVGMSFLNENSGYIIMNMDSGNIATTYYGGCALYKTSDGGNSWLMINKNIFQNLNVADQGSNLYFRNNEEGFCAGREGIYHTKDGGITWQNERPSDNMEYGYHFIFPTSSCCFAIDGKGNVFKRIF